MNHIVKLFTVAAIASTAAIATPAAAAPVIYTIAGTFNGIYNSHLFLGQKITFTATGDTDNSVTTPSGQTSFYELSSFTALFKGVTLDFKPGMTMGFNTLVSGVSGGDSRFLGGAGIGPLIEFATPHGYDGSTSLDKTSLGFILGGFSFTGNNFNNFSIINGRGSLEADVAAVPESGTWAMMLIGFGAVGFAMRRRKNVSTAVRFA